MSIADFLRKIGVLRSGTRTWKGDTKDRPLDDPDQQQKMADLDRKIDDATDNTPSNDSGSSEW